MEQKCKIDLLLLVLLVALVVERSSVSRAILANFPNEKIAMIEHDSYYKDQSHLTFEERIKTNYDHPLPLIRT